jgi:hypothetical protein
MLFKQNYLYKLSDYIQIIIYLLVRKFKFNICLKHVDNQKIMFFHKFNKMITNN